MVQRKLWHTLAAIMTAVALLCQGTMVLAGTSGTLSGTVVDDATKQPITGAKVNAVSPSQSAIATTDATGRFNFLALAPDTYLVSIEKAGYDTATVQGVTVTADQVQSVQVNAFAVTKVIGRTTARPSTDLVRPGVTADVYTINPTTAQKAQALGGGGALTQAYSAIASVPGVYVPVGQSGWLHQVVVRGSTFDQTGFEYDGVPVNRAFDNYPAHTAPTIGQQELQVYTGGGPAGASATGLGGFVNQVVRNGTYPGFANAQVAIGGPSYYHNFNFEIGGATPNRLFSWYGGFSGFNQNWRYLDQFNGVSNPLFKSPLVTPSIQGNGNGDGVAPICVNGAPPASAVVPAGTWNRGLCYGFAPGALESKAQVTDREFVSNFHIGIPHRSDDGKDDIQLLYTASALSSFFADSPRLIAPFLQNAFGSGATNYKDAWTFPKGTVFGQPATGLTASPYFFPSSSTARPMGGPIPADRMDGVQNDASIIKLQYQKNMGSKAYMRIFGYSFYSDWLNNGAVSAGSPIGVLPVNVPVDYELSTHTRGLEFQLADQITNEHLLQFTANYTTANSTRWNNGTPSNSLTTKSTNLTDAAGNCYNAAGALAACNSSTTRGSFGNPTPFAATGAAAAAGATWIVTTPGQVGSYNTVSPKFSSFSLTDNWKPSDKLTLNLGLRFERFEYDMKGTNDPGNLFWANAALREACYNPTTLAAGTFALNCAPGLVHPNGLAGSALYNNNYPLAYAPTVLEPRAAATFRMSDDTVLRASYGRYAEPPNTASVHYTRFEPNTPGFFFGKFSAVGFFSPFHAIRPAVASNYDFSLEQHLRGTDMSFKLTPFARVTKDDLQNVFIDQTTQFASFINAGTATSKGIEFQFNKGDFNRNGFAFQASYTYTDVKIKYQNLGNSSVNPIDQINASIAGFNAFTQAGGGSPCYSNINTGTGAPVACAADPTAIRNPYYNLPMQALLDRNGSYTPFTFTPAVQGAVQGSYYAPHVFALLLNYKHDKLSISPSFQVIAGQKYGAPLNQLGWDPTSCNQNQAAAGIPSAVAAGLGQNADWTSCTAQLNIPNYETGTFDRMGAYTQPTQLVGNLQISYDLSKQVRLNVLVANLINNCFGGSRAPWTVGGSGACNYGLDPFFATPGVSNNYNGTGPNDVAANGTAAIPYNAHAYSVQSIRNPIQLFVQLNLKL